MLSQQLSEAAGSGADPKKAEKKFCPKCKGKLWPEGDCQACDYEADYDATEPPESEMEVPDEEVPDEEVPDEEVPDEEDDEEVAQESLSAILFRAIFEDDGVKPQTKKGMKMVFGRWVDTGKKWAGEKVKKAEAGKGFSKGLVKGFKSKVHHGDDHGDGHEKPKEPPKEEPKGLKAKLKAFGEAVKKVGKGAEKAFNKLNEKGKRLWADPEYRKETFSRENLAEKAGEIAGKTLGHMAHEGIQAKDAGKALWKIRNTDVKDIGKTWKEMPEADKKAIKGTIKAVALTVGGTVAMGGLHHLGPGHLAQHFAAEALGFGAGETGVAALMAHRLLDLRWDLMTEAEREEAADDQVKWLVDKVNAKLVEFGEMDEGQAQKLLAKLAKQSEMSEDQIFESYFR